MRQALRSPRAHKSVTFEDDVYSVDSVLEYHDTVSVLHDDVGESFEDQNEYSLDPTSNMVTMDMKQPDTDSMSGIIET